MSFNLWGNIIKLPIQLYKTINTETIQAVYYNPPRKCGTFEALFILMKTYRQQCFRYIQCFTRCESGIDFSQLCLLCVGLLDIDSPWRPSRHFLKWRPFDKTVSGFFNKAMCQKQPQRDSIMSFNELRGLNARMMLQSNQDKTNDTDP